ERLPEPRAFGQLANRVHAGVDRQPLTVQHDVIEPHVLLLDVEIGAQGAGAGGVKVRDLLSHCTEVRAALALHYDADAEIHGGAYAHTGQSKCTMPAGINSATVSPVVPRRSALTATSQSPR